MTAQANMRNKANWLGEGSRLEALGRRRPCLRLCETKPMEAAGAICRVPVRASEEETPYGVTTNGDERTKQSQLALPGGLQAACETKPIRGRSLESEV
jgi:hypothetical protein